jgi:hypothetical protein
MAAKNNDLDTVECQVWENGKLTLSGFFRQVQNELKERMPTTSLIVMDSCSPPLSLETCKATILMAASPSFYIRNIENAVIIGRQRHYTIPALTEPEALGIASVIGVDHDIVKTNQLHMGYCALSIRTR